MAMCWANDFLVVSQLKTLVVVVAAEIICNATFGIIHAQIACDSRKILQHSTANFTIMRLHHNRNCCCCCCLLVAGC